MAGLTADVGRAKAERMCVVLGDQLTSDAPSIDRLNKGSDVVLMMEVEEEATHVASHRQRTVQFLASMRHFASDLVKAGHRVRYVKLDDPHNTHSFTDEVKRAAKIYGPGEVLVTHPGEHRVMSMVRGWKRALDASVEVVEDTHFLVSPEAFSEWASGRKQLVMEYFYREQRKRLDVLMAQEGKPRGGTWNYDKENRRSFKGAPRPPEAYRPNPDDLTREVMEVVERRFPKAPGRMSSFGWPVTRRQGLHALRTFVDDRLARFGTFQDAMWTEQPWLYHSHISPLLNLKLLRPVEVYEAALESDAPLNSVEGFVRQIIGWREFIRGVYWHEGPDYVDRNALDEEGDLPEFYWTGQTEMRCMRDCIGQVLDHGYGHHIQRLMVTGNFALIAGIEPKQVSDWYLGMYVDGVDWVTAPNVLGMAMHADGGVVGTKPYAASGKYIKRMSNYCDDCAFDPNKRTGEDACPFNVFYWDFLIRHKQRFSGNNRMSMILKNVDRMAKSERTEITVEGRRLREDMGIA
jgi:deoxyribodipyrimidine photolyase-related protein